MSPQIERTRDGWDAYYGITLGVTRSSVDGRARSMAILWSTAARGSQVIPCVLIAGLPLILIPEGVTLTGWSAGALDAAWWPGARSRGSARTWKSWLSLAARSLWDEKAEPCPARMLSISSLTVNVSDIGLRADGTGGLATALFAARDSIEGTWITADVSTSATTVSVASTTGFASIGYPVPRARDDGVHLHHRDELRRRHRSAPREVRLPIQHHWYVGNADAALANPRSHQRRTGDHRSHRNGVAPRSERRGRRHRGELAFYA